MGVLGRGDMGHGCRGTWNMGVLGHGDMEQGVGV